MNLRLCLPLLAGVLTTSFAGAAEELPLWPGEAPGALGDRAADRPTLTAYFPPAERATGAAIVICPGGGYHTLAPHEGEPYARFLNERGIAGFVLKYRLGPAYHHPVMLQDVSRAIRLVRSRASEWKLDPHRIGVMGSSAGGHLASTAVTHFDEGRPEDPDPVERVSSRPDLGVLCYAVITMGPHTHAGSKRNLLGENPPAELERKMSSELQVSAATPPCFLWHTWEDTVVPVENALLFAEALRRNGVRFDLHICERGRHGIGLGPETAAGRLHPWTADFGFWLKERGFAR